MPCSGISGSLYGFIPSFSKESPYCSPSGCINLYFHQQCKRFPFSPQPHQHLLFVDSLMMVFLTGGEGNGNAFQYSYLENPMDRGAWRPIIHRVTKSWLRLSMHAFWLVWGFDSHFSSKGWCWTSFQHLASFVKNKVPIGKWVYLWAFYFVPLVYMSVYV